MSGTGKLDVTDLLILQYIIRKAEVMDGYPRVAVSEIALYLEKDTQITLARLKDLVRRGWILWQKTDIPLVYTFFPADTQHEMIAKLTRGQRNDRPNSTHMLP